ncbi:MAG: hypothetical protein UW30_C0018G0017 [Candidatus Giovannonibacteria bacterium GW2011_GWA2_44_13b]|nr:MAG: hypothetical protein UW30_C0018G0017 [Candidatus Giovannonibacteria bacterium GW2011_GWA2_44_13b]
MSKTHEHKFININGDDAFVWCQCGENRVANFSLTPLEIPTLPSNWKKKKGPNNKKSPAA